MLLTKRLLIEPFSQDHLTQKYVNWLNDPEVVKYSEQRFKIHTLESCQTYFDSFENSPHCFWAILIKDQNKHIGNMTAYIDPHHQVADIGILIGEKNNWGKGYGKEAWEAVCQYLLKKKQIRKVTAGAMANNLAMLKIMKDCGMKEEAIKRKQFLWNAQEIDGIYAAVFKES